MDYGPPLENKKMNNPAYALTIAGSDPSGGAGIQADLEVFRLCQVEGLSAISVITAQTARQFNALYPVPKKIISLQLSTLLEEYPVQAAKTGLLYSPQTIRLVTKQIKKHKQIKLIIDPILKATLGKTLLKKAALPSLKELIKLSFAITPNIDEASSFSGIQITNPDEMKQAASILHKLGCKNVVIKGGHLAGTPMDLLYDGSRYIFHEKKRVQGYRFHGLGCRFSAALTAYIARGYAMEDAFHAAQALMEKLLPSLILKTPPL
jgi:hydroxymethylpyrimidine/phosphomethylpyrimidine kinase